MPQEAAAAPLLQRPGSEPTHCRGHSERLLGEHSASYFYPGTMHLEEASTPGPREPLLQLSSFVPSESGAKCPRRRPLHPCCSARALSRLTAVDAASPSWGVIRASYFYPGTMHLEEASTPGPREPLLQLSSFVPSESGAKCPRRRPLHPCCSAWALSRLTAVDAASPSWGSDKRFLLLSWVSSWTCPTLWERDAPRASMSACRSELMAPVYCNVAGPVRPSGSEMLPERPCLWMALPIQVYARSSWLPPTAM